MGRHVMEALGKSRVTIEDGKVVSVTEPVVKYCPLFKKHRGIEELNEESIKENMQFRVDSFGMCSSKRQIRMGYFLNFGISEIMCLALKKNLVNAAVIAGDGCGTAVVEDPEIVQGMGGRISGLVETSPEECVINGIGKERILDPEKCVIDAFAGVEKAFAMHYRTVAVTVTNAEDAQAIRDAFGRNVRIFAVHTTGVTRKEAEDLFRFCDVITACASEHIREVAKTKSLLQAGSKVPIYAASEEGKILVQAKLDELNVKACTELSEDQPKPLV